MSTGRPNQLHQQLLAPMTVIKYDVTDCFERCLRHAVTGRSVKSGGPETLYQKAHDLFKQFCWENSLARGKMARGKIGIWHVGVG